MTEQTTPTTPAKAPAAKPAASGKATSKPAPAAKAARPAKAPARAARTATDGTATPTAARNAPAAAKAAPAKSATEATDKPDQAAPVELPEYVIVQRKRRYANTTTRVLDLKHPACPVTPVKLDEAGPVMTWAAECTDHDQRGYYRRKDIAEANAADPWIFCHECATAMGEYIPVKR
ncbi:hypothetical protein [Actinomadura keratinilytica]|uniref:Uncharacterized protein n=1 Tax=Actinomadura keratinilytica TaxID=547461 RepID=A0ABP7ZAP3_9ACTN